MTGCCKGQASWSGVQTHEDLLDTQLSLLNVVTMETRSEGNWCDIIVAGDIVCAGGCDGATPRESLLLTKQALVDRGKSGCVISFFSTTTSITMCFSIYFRLHFQLDWCEWFMQAEGPFTRTSAASPQGRCRCCLSAHADPGSVRSMCCTSRPGSETAPPLEDSGGVFTMSRKKLQRAQMFQRIQSVSSGICRQKQRNMLVMEHTCPLCGFWCLFHPSCIPHMCNNNNYEFSSTLCQ